MPKAVINRSHAPMAIQLSVGGYQCRTLAPAQLNGAGYYCPTHIVIPDAHLTALQALDPADHRRVQLGLLNVIDLPTMPGGEGFTDAAKAALAAAIAPWKAW